MKAKKSTLAKPKKSRDLPVTRAALMLVRSELKKDNTSLKLMIRALDKKLTGRADQADARFQQVDSRFDQIDKRFEHVDKRFEEIDKRFEQVDKRFEQIDKRFEQIDKRFEQIDKRFEQIDKRFEQMDAKIDEKFNILKSTIDSRTSLLMSEFAKLSGQVQRIAALVEEQNARNRFVLDGYTSLYDSQKNLEARVKALEENSFPKK